MTMMEDFYCDNCKGSHTHLCNSTEKIEKSYGKKDCEYCGEKNVNIRHLCKEKVKHLAYVCTNCGRVAVESDYLCNPVPIEESQKAKWKEIASQPGDLTKCKACGQPVSPPGHMCNRILPYICEFCGEEVKNSYHFCKGVQENAKYYCNNCGRLAVKKDEICVGFELK